jgi:hypothetical protein
MMRTRRALAALLTVAALAATAIACTSTQPPQPARAPSPVALSVTAGEGGSVAVRPEASADGMHPSGTTVTITATADKGYDFTAWQGLPEGATVTAGPAAVTTTGGTETSTASFTLTAAATVTASFRVESIPYNLHTTGAVTAAGSYALLSDPDNLTSTIDWVTWGRTNPPYGLLLHAMDSTNASRTTYYGAIAVGDRVDAWWGDSCQMRFKVAEVRPDPAGDTPRKLFVIDDVAVEWSGCSGQEMAADTTQLVEFRWRQPPWRVAADGLRELWEEPVPGPGRYQLGPPGDVFGNLSIVVPANMSVSGGVYYLDDQWHIGLVDTRRDVSLHLNTAGEETGRSIPAGVSGASMQNVDALLDQIAASVRVGRGQ